MRNVTASDPPLCVWFADTEALESDILCILCKYLLTVQLCVLLGVSPVVI